jgi:dienelactone hydrolase
MHTIVVSEDERAVLDELTAALRDGGVTVRTVGAGDAAAALGAVLAAGDRCTVVGVGESAGAALAAAAEHGGLAGFVSVGGRWGDDQVELIEQWPELPLLAVTAAGDRHALACAVDAYLASANPHSDLLVGDTPGMVEIAEWLLARMREVVEVTDVTCRSADGWEIHGTLRLPAGAVQVPAVVLLHTGRSDRAAYFRLERLLAEAQVGVLNIDWRGRGKSTNLGTYFELDGPTKAAAWRDAIAAIELLASHPRVDAGRLGALGCVHGAEYAVRAAWRDRRVRALVILTGYRPAEAEEEQLLVSGEVDVLYVNAAGHSITGAVMHELRDRAPRRSAQLIEYPGSALGYQLFEVDPGLEPRIVAWLAEVLA